MRQERIVLDLRWPNDSQGHDISQIIGCLSLYLREYQKRPVRYNNGSGRSLTIRRVRGGDLKIKPGTQAEEPTPDMSTPSFEERYGPWICAGCGKAHQLGEPCPE